MKKYHDFISAAVDQKINNPLAELSHSIILGSNDFITEIKNRFLQGKKPDRDLPAVKNLTLRPSFGKIEKAVEAAMPSDAKMVRHVKLYYCHRFSGRKLKEIGSRYGISLSGVTHASRRVRFKAEKDKKFGKILKKIDKVINM